MSKREIIESLSGLTAEERAEIRDEIHRLSGTSGPTPDEIALLDQEQAEFDGDGDFGQPLEAVIARLRARK